MGSKKVISIANQDAKKKAVGESWDLASETFLKNCEARNLRPRSIEYYKEVLVDTFIPFADKLKIQPNKICNEVIDEYVLFLKEKGNAIESVNTRLRGLRSFLNFLEENEYIDCKIKIRMLKTERHIIRTFMEDQLKVLLMKPDKTATFALYRDWAIVNFLIGTGVRLGTLIDIKIMNVDYVDREIDCTHTKNRQQLTIPLSVSLAKVLKEYLNIRGGEPEDFLFCNTYGEQMAERTVQNRLKMYCKVRLGADSGGMRYSPHDFRHTFAIMYIRNSGGDILTLQKLLGHQNLEMTRRYSNMLLGDIKKQFHQNSPLDSISNIKGSGRKSIKNKG